MGRRRSAEGPKIVIVGDPQLARWGNNIGTFREALGISQQELADRLDVSHVTVWRWENGKAEPRRHHKTALARELATTEQVLFS